MKQTALLLTEEEIKYILGLLGERPFKEVAVLVEKMINQHNEQQPTEVEEAEGQ